MRSVCDFEEIKTLWSSGSDFHINNVEFSYDRSSKKLLPLKASALLNVYIDKLIHLAPVKIVEVGTSSGGCTALLNELFAPEHLLTIDGFDETTEAFGKYMFSPRGQNICVASDVAQDDRIRVDTVYQEVFGDGDVDVVIDNSSHLYDLSLASFNILFPKLRQGGLYLIENWGWSHWNSAYFQSPDHPFYLQESASNLIFQAVMASASSPDLISGIEITGGTCLIRRGCKSLDSEFNLLESFLNRGRPVSFI